MLIFFSPTTLFKINKYLNTLIQVHAISCLLK